MRKLRSGEQKIKDNIIKKITKRKHTEKNLGIVVKDDLTVRRGLSKQPAFLDFPSGVNR